MLKNIIIAKATGQESEMILPARFLAIVKRIENEMALLQWNNKELKVKLDAPARPGETLLLSLKEEKGEQSIYRIMARRSPDPPLDGSTVNWHMYINKNENEHPYFLQFNYYRYSQKRYKDESKGPSFEIGILTKNLGFVVLRVTSFSAPYECRFLVDEKSKGELLDRIISGLEDKLVEEGYSIKLLPFKVARKKHYNTNLLIDKKV